MKFLYLAKQMGILKNFELLVVADRQCSSITFAKKHNIYGKVIKYTKKYTQELEFVLNSLKPDIIITTWGKILDRQIVKKYEGKMINLHYSLLPSFAGLMGIEPIENAYKQNCQYIGATCHYVNENVDAGKIISQTILKADKPIDRIINEVFQKACLILLNSIILVTNKKLLTIIENECFDYSPNLKFDASLFDEKFWKELSKQ